MVSAGARTWKRPLTTAPPNPAADPEARPIPAPSGTAATPPIGAPPTAHVRCFLALPRPLRGFDESPETESGPAPLSLVGLPEGVASRTTRSHARRGIAVTPSKTSGASRVAANRSRLRLIRVPRLWSRRCEAWRPPGLRCAVPSAQARVRQTAMAAAGSLRRGSFLSEGSRHRDQRERKAHGYFFPCGVTRRFFVPQWLPAPLAATHFPGRAAPGHC
jgi:hypothetical protein